MRCREDDIDAGERLQPIEAFDMLRAGAELVIFLNHPTDIHSHYQATTKLFMV
jgi:hypothetical protein